MTTEKGIFDHPLTEMRKAIKYAMTDIVDIARSLEDPHKHGRLMIDVGELSKALKCLSQYIEESIPLESLAKREAILPYIERCKKLYTEAAKAFESYQKGWSALGEVFRPLENLKLGIRAIESDFNGKYGQI